jgi:hypothetical protein
MAVQAIPAAIVFRSSGISGEPNVSGLQKRRVNLAVEVKDVVSVRAETDGLIPGTPELPGQLDADIKPFNDAVVPCEGVIPNGFLDLNVD